MNLLRHTSMCFLLLLFLFPQVHKAVHDFSHWNEFVCHAETDKHFHETGHQCEFCDYKHSVFNANTNFSLNRSVFRFQEEAAVDFNSFFSEAARIQLPPRAPPL